MADNEQDRAEAGSTDATGEGSFDQAFDAAFAASESEEADQTEATEAEAGDETTEPEADAAEEATPPTAEELGVDTSTPDGKRQFKALLAKWNTWQNRHAAKQAKAAEVPEPAPAAQQPAQAAPQATDADDPFETVYNIDFDSFTPSTGLREQFAEYDDGVYALVDKLVAERIAHARDGFKANDRTLRQTLVQREQQSAAYGELQAFAEQIKDHPDLPEKQAEFRTLATKYRQQMETDPKAFIRFVEHETGIYRDWRGAADDEQRRAGQQNQRIADKRLASVPRPTRAPTQRREAGGDMSFDDALNAEMRKRGLA